MQLFRCWCCEQAFEAFEEFHHECNDEFTGSCKEKENFPEGCLRDVVRLNSKNL